jgi:hypothetical protein
MSVFERFWKGDNKEGAVSASRPSRCVMTALGGWMSISNAPERGARFVLCFSAAAAGRAFTAWSEDLWRGTRESRRLHRNSGRIPPKIQSPEPFAFNSPRRRQVAVSLSVH